MAEPRGDDDVPGYQVVAAAMRWKAGEGTHAFHDPIRVPNQPEGGGRTNPFFVDFYQTTGNKLVGFEAREHTAQVPYESREEREARFRDGELPILFCSPTMELGVDIAQLNVVNMRNIPPTPANYAQRSGRAGRSGQPALVFSYCTTGSSHDQYFFKRPTRMVAGAVAPPRIDLANEDLIRSHVHAIWLAEAGMRLGASLKDILDLSGEQLVLPLLPHVRHDLENEAPRERAKTRAEKILATIKADLDQSDWYSEGWLDEVFRRLSRTFEDACQRWRDLYRAAMEQRDRQDRIVVDASRTADDRAKAKSLRKEAESQLELLRQSENLVQADFYSYRYFASEGFLPGYSFPRLPLSAFIPARRQRKGRDEFLSRSRFLAISEFGPRSIVYHEGSKYSIHKVILPVGDDVLTGRAKLCPRCGYLHPIAAGPGPDLCHHCRAAMQGELSNLFRLQNVSTKRRERINCDEEERVRFGYDLCTSMRFVEHGGRPSRRIAGVHHDGEKMAELIYGQAANLWRINLGWTRRKNKEEYGFVLDTERGFWQKNEKDDGDADDPLSPKRARVIPFVEDHRNCLLMQFDKTHDRAVMASLQAAIKNAIQVTYQLEDGELAAEPLPNGDMRRLILFYESSEGGAGILRQLVEDPGALARVAREALLICHFDPDTGEDKRRAPGTREDCGAACYDCMMSYSNQREHELLDRQLIRDLLRQLAAASVEPAPADVPRAEHLAQLKRLTGSNLENRWLDWLEAHDMSLPSRAQTLIEQCRTRPDFLYDEKQTAVYIDGPPHEFPERKSRDQQQTEDMEDYGYTVVRFSHDDDWLATHPKNAPLRDKLYSGTLTPQDYYRQLLRIVYRLLFLFVAEDRGLLLDPAADEKTRRRYVDYYSTARIRRLAERQRGTRHSDLYHGLVLVMDKLGSDAGCPELALPALGSFLWSPGAIADLVGCHIPNADLLRAVRELAFTVDGHTLRAVDYKNLGAEELGSVYESLLELHPKIHQEAGTFELGTAAGHERKTTGSYYTPTSLINCLLDSALDPVVDEAAKKPAAEEAEKAILNLKICDPACGSGHFLIAAAHRVGKRLAAVRTGDEEPAPDAVRTAVRDVIGRCIFGVDINPMAVELCKINLWLESLTPGRPLSFLDHHIQCGNSLLGATPALLKKGIPDEAFTPIEGDDKKVCAAMKRQNRDERSGQMTFFMGGDKPWDRMGDLAASVANLEHGDDDTVAGVPSVST